MLTALTIMLAASLQAPEPQSPGPSGLAFDCALKDYAATVAGRESDARRLAVFSSFKQGGGAVSRTYDPSGVLQGSGLASLRLQDEGGGSYSFVLRSAPGSARPVMLMVEPDGDAADATSGRRFMGVLGMTGRPDPVNIGKCVVLGGPQAAKLFETLP